MIRQEDRIIAWKDSHKRNVTSRFVRWSFFIPNSTRRIRQHLQTCATFSPFRTKTTPEFPPLPPHFQRATRQKPGRQSDLDSVSPPGSLLNLRGSEVLKS
jgi:hypothetical protein